MVETEPVIFTEGAVLRRTKFATMEEAIPHMHKIEAANIATNRAWGDLDKKTAH